MINLITGIGFIVIGLLQIIIDEDTKYKIIGGLYIIIGILQILANI